MYLSKAYDSVSRPFLHDVLLRLGFSTRFVEWIMKCIKTTSNSILINGDVHGFFSRRRGLRQGDPIFPYLFVICLEYFSRMLQNDIKEKDFNCHPQCASLEITDGT